ncbi:helix-turn-helix domain-containing protein [Vulcanisaeta thermophila]|uniref:helix-turn-helix domain-containing protein n=1 Tax=Vulcanisaeta thermophila TaxID=867917 RepID=UPI00138A6046|nr:helix-turn-helix domain-containing protein [Vulcanisaeta thermophila]
MNIVLALFKVDKKENDSMAIKSLKKDFLKLSILPLYKDDNNKYYIISGVKSGHGVLHPLIKHGATPLLPIIALPNAESFIFLHHDKSTIDEIIDEISHKNKNKLEYFDYKRISNGSEIMRIITKNFNEIYLYDLDDYERKVLKIAINMGYFDWPKRVKIDEIARELGVSKPMISYYLRKASRNIFDKMVL